MCSDARQQVPANEFKLNLCNCPTALLIALLQMIITLWAATAPWVRWSATCFHNSSLMCKHLERCHNTTANQQADVSAGSLVHAQII
jgi:hypothetical protein